MNERKMNEWMKERKYDEIKKHLEKEERTTKELKEDKRNERRNT